MEEQFKSFAAEYVEFDSSYAGTIARNQVLGPERALLLAVLEDGIHCFRKYRMARGGAGRRQFLETEHWIMREREDRLFGFENICEVLGLDPGYVRRGLLQWQMQAAATLSEPRHSGFRRRAA